MTTSEAKVKMLAEQLSKALETRERNNGDKFVCLKDGSPDWMKDVIHAVHGEALPNDVTYRFIEKCADAIAESSDDPYDAVCDIECDIYTADLMDWARGNYEYCEQAIEEGLWESNRKDGNFIGLLSVGQHIHIREIGNALIDALDDADVEIK